MKKTNFSLKFLIKFIVVSSFIVSSFYSNAGGDLPDLKFHFNTSINANFSINKPLDNEFIPTVYNYPHQVLGFSALDEAKFSADKMQRSTSFYLPYTVQIGLRKIIDEYSNVQIEAGFMNIVKKSNHSSGLRFSDQISKNQGYVQPTRFLLEDSYYKSNLLNVSVGYERQFKSRQYLSAKLGFLKLIESSYFLNISDASNNHYDYVDNDLSFNNGFVVPQMSVRYMYQLSDRKINTRIYGEFTGTNQHERMNFQSGTFSIGLQFVQASNP